MALTAPNRNIELRGLVLVDSTSGRNAPQCSIGANCHGKGHAGRHKREEPQDPTLVNRPWPLQIFVMSYFWSRGSWTYPEIKHQTQAVDGTRLSVQAFTNWGLMFGKKQMLVVLREVYPSRPSRQTKVFKIITVRTLSFFFLLFMLSSLSLQVYFAVAWSSVLSEVIDMTRNSMPWVANPKAIFRGILKTNFFYVSYLCLRVYLLIRFGHYCWVT